MPLTSIVLMKQPGNWTRSFKGTLLMMQHWIYILSFSETEDPHHSKIINLMWLPSFTTMGSLSQTKLNYSSLFSCIFFLLLVHYKIFTGVYKMIVLLQ